MTTVLRNIAFYLVFYFGSIGYVVWAMLVIAAPNTWFCGTVRAWSQFHAVCARVLLGIDITLDTPVLRSGVIYAVKHESFYEAIDLPRLFDLPVVFAKAELLRIPLWGRVAAHYGLVAVEREAGAKALRAMISAARAHSNSGRPLVIFPEGTRVRHGLRPSLQAGFAGLYKLMGLPVIPVAVNSGPIYHRRLKQAGTITYRFGEEIPAGLPRDEVEARVHAAINALNAAD